MQSKNVDVWCARCHGAGHIAKDCTKKSFMRIETVAEERERKHKEWQERQCQRQEKKTEWEERQRKKQAEWEKMQCKRQEKQAEWAERQRKAEDTARRMAEEKAKKEIEEKRKDEARKKAEERAMKEVEEETKCEAVEKANKKMEAKTKTKAERSANQHHAVKACELQHKEAQQKCDDQASTRASSPDPTSHSNLMCDLPKFGVSKFEKLLQKLQHARVGGAQAQIAQLVSEIVSEFNRTMPGWEIPLRPDLRAEQGAIAGSNIIGVPHSQQETSCQVVTKSTGIGVEKVLEQTWASRALLNSASIPARCRPQIVNHQMNTAKIQNNVDPNVKQLPKTVLQNKCQAAKLHKNLLQNQIQTKNQGKCTLKTSSDLHPKIIKSGTISGPKTDPATWPAIRSHEIEFILDSPLSVLPTHSVCSPSLTVGNFSFKILVFPRGTQKAAGKHLGAFVLAEPGDVEPDCIFKNVKFEITLVTPGAK